jgi:SAM-dependent methyltransferase
VEKFTSHVVSGEREVRVCPVCAEPATNAHLFLEERIDPAGLGDFSFASRKEPEFFNYRMVRCSSCDVVFVDRPPTESALHQAYHQASYDSSEEADDAAAAYLRELAPVLGKIGHGAALEIGTGTGVLLDGLVASGFGTVMGVEPSRAAIEAAPPHRVAFIMEGIFEEDAFTPSSFDLVCCFMTLEHVRQPRELAESVLRLLKPGGSFVVVVHDYRSRVNRVLGRRSPIIDVEHMQLFSAASVSTLFSRAGYTDISTAAFTNRYAMSYWLRLLPLPRGVKRMAQRLLSALRLSRKKVSINVGNMLAVGYRPHHFDTRADETS